MTLTAAHLERVLRAIPGAYGRQIASLDVLAQGANESLAAAPAGLTVQGAAAFLATMSQESASLRTTEEYAKHGRYAPYIGRTFEQITWRDNYSAFGAWCHSLPLEHSGYLADPSAFVAHPKLLADVRWAWLGGVWFWQKNGIWAYGNRGDFLATQRAVNLGNPNSTATPNGISARRAWYAAWLAIGADLLPTNQVPTTPQTKPSKDSDVKHDSHYGDYVQFRGGKVPPVVRDILTAIPSRIDLYQGGLSRAVPGSANTHVGLGCYDIKVIGWTTDQIKACCSELLRSGEVPFARGPRWKSNFSPEHIHVCSNNCYKQLHQEARDQIDDFKSRYHGNGLSGRSHGKYVGPSTPLGSWKDSPYNPANIRDNDGGVMIVQTDTLLGLNVDRKQTKVREKGYVLTYVRQVKRWGRWNCVTASGTYYAISDDNGTYLAPKPEPVEVQP